MRSILLFTFINIFFFSSYAQNCSNPPTSIFASAISATCGQNNGSIVIDSVRNGTAPFSFSLNGNSFQSVTSFNGLGSGTYTLSVKDNNGCVFNSPVNLTITKTYGPSLSTISSTPVSSCSSNDGSITINAGGGLPPYTFQLNNLPFQSSGTYNGLGAGSYAAIVRDAAGCDTNLYINIQDPGGIELATITSILPTVCGSSTGNITVQSNVGSPAVSFQLNNGALQSSPTFSGLASNLYNISLYDANNCKYTIFNIWISSLSGPSITSSSVTNDICNKRIGSISINTVTGGTAPYSYAINGGAFGTATSFNNLSAGTYTISIKDANGCRKDTSINVPLTTGPTNISATLTDSDCGLNNGSISNVISIGGTAPYTFSWNTGQSSQNLNALAPGTYTLTVNDNNQCSFSKSFNIAEINKINDITVNIQNVNCGTRNGSINISSVTGGLPPYKYAINGGSFQNTTTFANLAPGAYAIVVEDNKGCVYETSVSINAANLPTCSVLTSASENTINAGQSVNLYGTGSGPKNFWSGNTGVTDTLTNDVSVSPNYTSTFTFTSSFPQEGCETKCPVKIIVIPKITPKDVFSPNADGKNDKWEIINISFFENAEVSVYSRWGQRVYHAKKGYSDENAWDGTNQGASLQTATYYYIINLHNEDETKSADVFTGSVTILR